MDRGGGGRDASNGCAPSHSLLPLPLAFTPQVEAPQSGADGFRVKLIDTCGLEDPEAGDSVNQTALRKIAQDIKGMPIDVVLYVDRLDLYRVEPLDKAVRLRYIWAAVAEGSSHPRPRASARDSRS